MLIRNFKLVDLPSFLTYRNDPLVAKYQSWKTPLSEYEGKEFIEEQMDLEIGVKNTWHQLAIEHKQTNEHVGDCAIFTSNDGKQAEFGITIARKHQKNGYAYETLRNLFDYLFNKLSYHRITALVDSSNENSLLLMKKLKMRQEGYYKESYFTGSVWTDEVQFALLKSDFTS